MNDPKDNIRRYALSTIIVKYFSKFQLDDHSVYATTHAPQLAEENNLNPSEFNNIYSIYEKVAINNEPDSDLDEIREEDELIKAEQFAEANQRNKNKVITDAILTEIIDEAESSGYDFLDTEFGGYYECGDYYSTEDDTLDTLAIIKTNEGNKYFKRLLLNIFNHYGSEIESFDVVDYYNKASKLIGQKIEDGVIPEVFNKKLQLYQPNEFVYEDKLMSILNQVKHNWSGYYDGTEMRFALIEDYDKYLPSNDIDNKFEVEFREPGTEDSYQEDSDFMLGVAIHELFHHLSGHAFRKIEGEAENIKVGFSTISRGRMLNEAVTERLASLVYPETHQTYDNERAILHLIQTNSNGLITDELIYDAYAEERELGGLPKFKLLLQTANRAFEYKGFLQHIENIYENDGYLAAVDFIRTTTEKAGRNFVELPVGPPSSSQHNNDLLNHNYNYYN